MISTLPFGSSIACEIPVLAPILADVPQSSADFRPEGSVPETLSDLLPFAGKKSRKHWNRTFELIVEWKGSEVFLTDLFLRTTMNSFRPFLRTCGGKLGYLESTIVFHRKGLGYLRKLAASLGVDVEPVYKDEWLKVMTLAKENHCLAMAEPLEDHFACPSDVSLDDLDKLTLHMVTTRQKRMSGARKAKFNFLAVMCKCGFDLNPIATARKEDYLTPVCDMPQPLKSQTGGIEEWLEVGTQEKQPWKKGWRNYDSNIQTKFKARREITRKKVVADICRMFGFVKNVDGDAEGIDSLETLFQPEIACCYADWLGEVHHMGPGSLRTTFGGLFAALRNFPGAKVDLSWSTDFIAALPEYNRNDRNARKLPRMVPLSRLDTIPDLLIQEREMLIVRHKRAETAESTSRRRRGDGTSTSTDMKHAKARATRLTRIAVLAQHDLIVDWLVTLAWRNENLIGMRIHPEGEKPANLLHIPADEAYGADLDDEVIKLQKTAPKTLIWIVNFAAEETKAARAVRAVVPQSLGAKLDVFIAEGSYRDMLLCGNKSAHLFLTQRGTSMSAQQLEEAVEEVTAIHVGRAINPHLFRDIYALAYLKANNGDYLTLSKILWHKNHLVTTMEYGWMYDESVGTNVAGKWRAERSSAGGRIASHLSPAQQAKSWLGAAGGWREARRGQKRSKQGIGPSALESPRSIAPPTPSLLIRKDDIFATIN